jgi:DnaJ family protein C protein 7
LKYQESISDCNVCLELLDKITFPYETRVVKQNGESIQDDISIEDRESSQQSALYFKIYLRRADSSTKSDLFEEALRDYERALKMKPNDNEVKLAIRTAKKALTMSKQKNYYKILGVDRNASDSEIKKAYRKLALIFHPGI